jgi:hypothetical protein
LSSAREAEKRWRYSLVLEFAVEVFDESSAWVAVTRGLEGGKLKTLLLKAVAREWLINMQQAGKGLASAVVICKVWRLVVAL